MPHLSLCLPLPLRWAAFARGKEEKMVMEITLHHPTSLPFPSVLCLSAFQSNTSCCFFCTLPGAAQGGWWRCKIPFPHAPRLSPWWNAVDSTGWPLVPSYIRPLPPSLSASLQQPFRGQQKQRSETSSYLNREIGKYLFLQVPYMIGAFFFL